MERDVMDIVKEKEFIELTAEDRAELGELCASEDEYNQIKSMFVGMSTMDWSNPTPKAETKASLDALFAQTHPKAAPIWYNAPLAVLVPKGKPFYRQPLVQVAAVGLLMLLAYPFINSTSLETKSDQIAAVEDEMTTSESEPTETKNEISEEDVLVETTSQNQAKVEEDEKVEMPIPAAPPSPRPLSASSTLPKDVSGMNFSGVVGETLEEVELIRGSAWSTSVASSTPVSTHPDGVFIGDNKEVFSVPASQEPEVFDLLTATF
ncbi:MAG: hypothetical protein HWE22_07010 [Flavobacteriales bacterium]|nr:hypothetical protein [Flavobacteriales bacterium]